MTRIALLAAGCAVLALAACDHPDAERQRSVRALKVISKLDCPAEEGVLKLVSTAPDGLSCIYKGANDAEVTLRLVTLEGGDAGKALGPIEAELRALMPGATPAAKPAQAEADARGGGKDEVDIHLPGVTIKAGDAGANINVGDATIDANDDGAEIRVSRNVEIDGKRVEREVHRGRHRDEGVYSRFILASDRASGGYAVVGYEARGPIGGPLVVATLKGKKHDGDGDGGDTFRDVQDLIRHNVGGRRTHGAVITVD